MLWGQATPFEVTTMAGRRLRQTMLTQLESAGVTRVVLVGLANAYAGYMATREEYAQQDYEGASTHFGPWQLARQPASRCRPHPTRPELLPDHHTDRCGV